MKLKLNKIYLAAVALLTMGFVSSCSDDDMGPSIFDTVEHPLDRTSATFPLDTFLVKNFREPYNLKFIYKMEDIGSDQTYNLVPAAYSKSEQLAVLAKYLWYDVYAKVGSVEFLKENSPRIIHVIGSPAYNPTSGTETLGVAEGGLKITLYNVNNLNIQNIDQMNEKFFKTMHHEFGHILQQTVATPTAFNLISQGSYNALDWQNTPDSLAAAQGFVSPYASSQAREDWVEVLANYIVKDSITWNGLLNTASYDWEKVEVDAKTFDQEVAKGAARDTIGYYLSDGTKSENTVLKYNVVRKVVARDANGNVSLKDKKIQYLDQDGINGRTQITRKLEMVRTWLKENFGIDLDKLREEVQKRQWATNADGSFKFDNNGKFINHLTEPLSSDPSKTFMDTLLEEVEQYKALQKK